MINTVLELAELLEAARPFVADCMDVIDGADGRPEANPAMILTGRIDEALADVDRLWQAMPDPVAECDLCADVEPFDTIVSDDFDKS